MRRILLAGVAMQMLIVPALAQTNPANSPPSTGSQMEPTEKTPGSPETAVPNDTPASTMTHQSDKAAGNKESTTGKHGRNSFTEAQATHKLEAAGYSKVTGLAKDKDGIWRGTATQGSALVPVGVDYRGTIVKGDVVTR